MAAVERATADSMLQDAQDDALGPLLGLYSLLWPWLCVCARPLYREGCTHIHSQSRGNREQCVCAVCARRWDHY